MSVAESLPFAEEIPTRLVESTPGRLGGWPVNSAVARVGVPWRRRLSRAALLIDKVRHFEKQYLGVPDERLTELSLQLRGKARGKWDLDELLPEAFGLVSVAIQRTLGIRPFDVQLAAGVVMHYGGLVELATGEGKTLSPPSPRRS